MKYIFFLATLSTLFISCVQQPCDPNNSVLSEYGFNASRSNIALAQMIRETPEDEMKITFDSYHKRSYFDYIILKFENAEGCALGEFMLNNINVWQEVIETQGKGFEGANIEGFEFKVNEGTSSK